MFLENFGATVLVAISEVTVVEYGMSHYVTVQYQIDSRSVFILILLELQFNAWEFPLLKFFGSIDQPFTSTTLQTLI